jgi:hypothetical protein
VGGEVSEQQKQLEEVHTTADPPNQGRIILAMRGWTWKRRKAL